MGISTFVVISSNNNNNLIKTATTTTTTTTKTIRRTTAETSTLKTFNECTNFALSIGQTSELAVSNKPNVVYSQGWLKAFFFRYFLFNILIKYMIEILFLVDFKLYLN